jgi:hypothetical protein
MSKQAPDHHDAELVLKVYDLRREPVMRESRDLINRDYWPRNEAEAVAVLQPEHPLNRPYRQVSTYWEMVYGLCRHGVAHTDFLLDSNGEGLLLFARVEPYLDAIRRATSARSFAKAEWVANTSEVGRQLMEIFRRRVRARLGR